MHHSVHRQRTRRGDQASEIEDQRDATVRHHGRAGNAGQPAQARAERLDHDLLAADDFAHDDSVALVADLRDDDVARTPRRRRAEPAIEMPEPQLGYTRLDDIRSEAHTSELQSLMRISSAVICFQHKTITTHVT